MRVLLHILTRPDDALAAEIIRHQQASDENNVVVMDLTGGRSDYKELLEKVFAADTVQAW